jgi:hypothetical protein
MMADRDMTDAERERMAQMEKMVQEIHRALLAPAPDGGPSFYTRASVVVTTAERGQWAAKWAVRVVLFIGACITILATYRGGSAGQ